MTQEEARGRILAEWRTLQEEKKKSIADRLTFAMEAMKKYPFRCSGDTFQVIAGWLERESA